MAWQSQHLILLTAPCLSLGSTLLTFHSDIISRENFTVLIFSQVISKAWDFKAELKTESATTKQHLEEMAHKVLMRHHIIQLNNNQMHILALVVFPPAFGVGWLRTLSGTTARHQMSSAIVVGNGATGSKYVSSPLLQMPCQSHRRIQPMIHNLLTSSFMRYIVYSAPKGIFVDLDLSLTPSSSSSHSRLCCQVDSDLQKFPQVKTDTSAVCPLDYSKTIIPTQGQTSLHCSYHGKS